MTKSVGTMLGVLSCNSEFGQGDGVDVHGVWVNGGLRGGQVQREREFSAFQGKDAHFLRVENLCLFNPGSDSGWDGSHGKDHGSELLV